MVSSAETMGAFKTGVDAVNLRQPTSASWRMAPTRLAAAATV